MNKIWPIIGVLLLIWVGWDLYMGYTYTWEFVSKASQPITYWIAIAVWSVLAISCFFSVSGKK